MKKLLIILLSLSLASCEQDVADSKAKKITKMPGGKDLILRYYEIKIEGCEYIVTDYDRSRSVTHKGNCTNPIHYKQVNTERQ